MCFGTDLCLKVQAMRALATELHATEYQSLLVHLFGFMLLYFPFPEVLRSNAVVFCRMVPPPPPQKFKIDGNVVTPFGCENSGICILHLHATPTSLKAVKLNRGRTGHDDM